jgi:nicotinamide phosphoribosyltransferase
MKLNPLHLCDSYKLGHMAQYPVGTSMVYANFTPRSLHHLNATLPKPVKKIVWFGLQGLLKEMISVWDEGFFKRDIEEVIHEFSTRIGPFVGPSGFDYDKIRDLHKIGYLPLKIKALPEGSLVPEGVPCLTICNTSDNEYWLVNYIESYLSAELWKCCTSATIARTYRLMFDEYAEKTGSPKEFIPWQGHDFSFRGMSGVVDAAKSGAGHLLSFTGSDSIPAVDYIEEYYRGKESGFTAGSVPATEHSVMCMGSKEDEISTFRRLITEVYPAGIVSIVSDTWDFWKVVTEYSKELKPEIMNRQKDMFGNCKSVLRPDSGNPVHIICGIPENVVVIPDYCQTELDAANHAKEVIHDLYLIDTPHGERGCDNWDLTVKWQDNYYKINAYCLQNRHDKQFYFLEEVIIKSFEKIEHVRTPEQKGAIECLWEIFGGTITSTGHKLLDSHIGLIYGDSITPQRCKDILEGLEKKGFASGNVILGIGSYTYQYNTRDTLGFAMKSTYGEINGIGKEIFKDPKTDSGLKKSAKGLLRVIKDEDGEFKLLDQQTREQEETGELELVYSSGVLFKDETFADIRFRLSDSEG